MAKAFLRFPRGGASVFPAVDGDDLPDLVEADVWYSELGRPAPDGGREEERTTTKSTGGRAARRGVGELSRAFGDGRREAAASSAPVEVPAWPSRFFVAAAETAEAIFEDQRRQEEEWVPPHVYLARRQARASVVEGAGRTLKGRDMSRVRDAVWSRTGFDG